MSKHKTAEKKPKDEYYICYINGKGKITTVVGPATKSRADKAKAEYPYDVVLAKFKPKPNKYRCPRCGIIVERYSDKKWMNSICNGEATTRLQLIKEKQ